MPEARLQRTRENYDSPLGVSLRFIQHFNAAAQQYPTMADVELVRRFRHESAKPCGCDPAVNHYCELHAGE